MPVNGKEKLRTSLPVSYLSVGVRLLMDSGLLQVQNATELMKVVARNFRTEKSDRISEDSLRNKAYNIDPSVVEGMKDVMVRMMNLLRQY